MTQIITGTSQSYNEKDYAIVTEGAAWATTNYLYGDLRLFASYQNGEMFNSAKKFNKELIDDRFNYPDR